jgi:hypothetical protein
MPTTHTAKYYNYFRDYSPDTGRYLQPEPLGVFGDINLYRYARTNPLGYIDPDGAQAIPVPPPPFPFPGNPPGPRGRSNDDPFSNPPSAPPKWPSIPDWLSDLLTGKNYTCEVRCNVQQIDPCVICPDRVNGTGTGKTKKAACKAAQKNANSQVPRGCYKRICHEI